MCPPFTLTRALPAITSIAVHPQPSTRGLSTSTSSASMAMPCTDASLMRGLASVRPLIFPASWFGGDPIDEVAADIGRQSVADAGHRGARAGDAVCDPRKV